MAINIGGKYLLKCKIITPLFMGGASQQAELRTQSFNGLLRWWFRVAGGSINDEKRIFGWAGKTSNQGLCRIFIKDFDKLKKKLFSKEFDNSGRVRQDKGINYLGFSLDQRFKKDDKNKIQREYLERNQQFEIKISFHPKANDDDIKKFFSSLWLAFNLGNFGSRARRGFGSIKIENIKENEKDITNDCFGLSFVPSGDLKNWVKTNLDRIKNILNPSQRSNIPYVFDNFEIYLFDEDKDWKNLLNKAGMAYRDFRRNESLDDRIVFGLPIVSVSRYRNLRRASPLIFKVIEINKNNYALLFIIMKPNDKNKFIFHPERKNVKWNLLSNFVSSKTKIYP